MNSKPFHPATVHFPIAFFSTSWSLDLLYYTLTTVFPRSGTTVTKSPLLPSLPTLSQASHYLLILGILSGVVSVVSGGAQLVKLIQNAGLYEADGKTMRPKVRTALTHATLNDLTVVTAVWSWWLRRGNVEAGSGAPVPTMMNVVISAVSLPVLLYSADLGGSLVYNYGVGINLAKRGKAN